jgi:hypothetical protein
MREDDPQSRGTFPSFGHLRATHDQAPELASSLLGNVVGNADQRRPAERRRPAGFEGLVVSV